jgi:ABC-type uncharacterized transport system permease subunit
MSRKTLTAVLGIIGAILVFLKGTFGLDLDAAAITTALGVILTYVLFEAKLDIAKVGLQLGKWKDPKFWVTFIAAILTALNGALGWSLPIETINAVLGVILAVLFGWAFKKTAEAKESPVPTRRTATT